MKVVVTGKGGAGKTTVAAILARNLARDGANVVAVDADPNPNLGIALGLGMAMTASLDAVINGLVAEDAHRHLYDGDSGPPPGGDGEALLDRFGVVGPDGVRLVQTGRIERPTAGCLCCGSHLATRHMFADLHADDRVVLTDLEAGVLDLLWVKPQPDTAVLVVTNPDRGSLDVAANSVAVARDLKADRVMVIANRVEGVDDLDTIRQSVPDVPLVEVPEDAAIGAAERQGRSVVDTAPGCTAVAAIQALALRLVADSDGPRL